MDFSKIVDSVAALRPLYPELRALFPSAAVLAKALDIILSPSGDNTAQGAEELRQLWLQSQKNSDTSAEAMWARKSYRKLAEENKRCGAWLYGGELNKKQKDLMLQHIHKLRSLRFPVSYDIVEEMTGILHKCSPSWYKTWLKKQDAQDLKRWAKEAEDTYEHDASLIDDSERPGAADNEVRELQENVGLRSEDLEFGDGLSNRRKREPMFRTRVPKGKERKALLQSQLDELTDRLGLPRKKVSEGFDSDSDSDSDELLLTESEVKELKRIWAARSNKPLNMTFERVQDSAVTATASEPTPLPTAPTAPPTASKSARKKKRGKSCRFTPHKRTKSTQGDSYQSHPKFERLSKDKVKMLKKLMDNDQRKLSPEEVKRYAEEVAAAKLIQRGRVKQTDEEYVRMLELAFSTNLPQADIGEICGGVSSRTVSVQKSEAKRVIKEIFGSKED